MLETLQEIITILTYLEFVVRKQQSILNEYDSKALKFINSLRNATQYELELLAKLYKRETELYKRETE